jgi:hypothetical protein
MFLITSFRVGDCAYLRIIDIKGLKRRNPLQYMHHTAAKAVTHHQNNSKYEFFEQCKEPLSVFDGEGLSLKHLIRISLSDSELTVGAVFKGVISV